LEDTAQYTTAPPSQVFPGKGQSNFEQMAIRQLQLGYNAIRGSFAPTCSVQYGLQTRYTGQGNENFMGVYEILDRMEKDLSRVSKKFSKPEIAQTVRLVANGIQEALNYLAIVAKVIEKTERALAKRNTGSDSATLSTGETLV